MLGNKCFPTWAFRWDQPSQHLNCSHWETPKWETQLNCAWTLKPQKLWENKCVLLISGLACKELSGHCFILTSKKLNELKNQPFLDLLEKWSHRTNCCPPPKLKRQADAENHNLLELKPVSRNLHRNQSRGRNIWTVINKLLEAQCRWVCELKSAGVTMLLWVNSLPPGALPGSHSEDWRKKWLVQPAERGGKWPFLNMPEHSVLLNKTCPQEKLDPNWWGLQEPNHSGARRSFPV